MSKALRREIDLVLPQDLPRRGDVVRLTAQHHAAVVRANEELNLTRITAPFEAAAKHGVVVIDEAALERLRRGEDDGAAKDGPESIGTGSAPSD